MSSIRYKITLISKPVTDRKDSELVKQIKESVEAEAKGTSPTEEGVTIDEFLS